MHSIHVSAYPTALPSSDDDGADYDDDGDDDDDDHATDDGDDDAELTCGHKGAPGWSDRGKPLISAHSSLQNNHRDPHLDHLDPHLDHRKNHHHREDENLNQASYIRPLLSTKQSSG